MISLNKDDINLIQIWLKHLRKYFNITNKITFNYVYTNKTHPDIWIDLKTNNITVTNIWTNCNKMEKEKRLTHEILHYLGYQHWQNYYYILFNELQKIIPNLPTEYIYNKKYVRLLYSTHPKSDTFSMIIYLIIKQSIPYKLWKNVSPFNLKKN
jgi:hypothetical protein